MAASRTRPSNSRKRGSPPSSQRTTTGLTKYPTRPASAADLLPATGVPTRSSCWPLIRWSSVRNAASKVMNGVAPAWPPREQRRAASAGGRRPHREPPRKVCSGGPPRSVGSSQGGGPLPAPPPPAPAATPGLPHRRDRPLAVRLATRAQRGMALDQDPQRRVETGTGELAVEARRPREDVGRVAAGGQAVEQPESALPMRQGPGGSPGGL